MRIAVTGANGYVGRAIADAAHESGHQLVLNHRALDGHVGRETTQVVWGDLEEESVRRALTADIDVLVHCAGVTRSGSEQTLRHTNVTLARRMAQAAQSTGVRRFILLSSTGVYGLPGCRVSEDTEHRPANSYERSKSDGERAIADALIETELCIIRPSNVVGRNRTGAPLLRFLRRVSKGPIVYGRGAQVNYVHVCEVAWATVIAAATEKLVPSVIVNDSVSMEDFVTLARDALGARDVRDLVLPASAAARVRAVLAENRGRHSAVSRTLALVDTTYFVGERAHFVRMPESGVASMKRTLNRLVADYREAGKLA